MTDDDVKGDLMQRSREWLQSCVNAATRSGVPEEADLEAFILVHIDGEQARQDAAVAAAREEQREADAKFCPNCLGVGFVERPVPCPYCDDSTHDHYCPTGTQRQQCGCGAERIRGTPLTATPLADRIAELEAENDGATAAGRKIADRWVDEKDRADYATAALRLHGFRECDIAACNCGSWHAPPNLRAEKAEAERDALRAQVEAARRVIDEMRDEDQRSLTEDYVEGRESTARDALAAMDGAKP